jgi:hypothetical protein
MSPIGNPVYPPLSSTVNLQGAQNAKISIITAILANTEYSLSLQTDLKQLRIKARNSSKLKIAFVSGDIALGDYWTINKGCVENIDAISFTGKILYIESNTAITEIEVMELY